MEVQEINDIAVITTPENIDAFNADSLIQIISDLMEQDKCSMVVDMSKTEFINSSGLSALIVKLPPVRSRGGDIRLVITQEFIISQLRITRLDEVLKCHATLDAAVSSYA